MIALCRLFLGRSRTLKRQNGSTHALRACALALIVALAGALASPATNAQAAGWCSAIPTPPPGGTPAPSDGNGVLLCHLDPPSPTAAIAVWRNRNTYNYALDDRRTRADGNGVISRRVWTVNGRVFSTATRPTLRLAPGEKALVRLTVWGPDSLTSSASTTVQAPTRKAAPAGRVTERAVTFSDQLLFLANSFDLSVPAQRTLNTLRSELLASHHVTFAGYSDSAGPAGSAGDEFSNWLSHMQALAVADYIYGNQVPASVGIIGYGRSHFIAPNSSWRGRDENRRIVISFTTG